MDKRRGIDFGGKSEGSKQVTDQYSDAVPPGSSLLLEDRRVAWVGGAQSKVENSSSS